MPNFQPSTDHNVPKLLTHEEIRVALQNQKTEEVETEASEKSWEPKQEVLPALLAKLHREFKER